jgi:polar amino acid transport system substrate-binding protein
MKGRATIFALLVAALAGCHGGSSSTPAGGTLDAIRARGVLLWGGDVQGGAPYVYEDPNHPGTLVGFEVDIANALAQHLGVRAQFVQIAWSSLVPSLERGDFDIALNGLEDTPERRERILLSRPYYVYGETLAVQAGSSLRFLDLDASKRIGTLNQTYAFDLLRSRGIEPVLYEGVQEPYLDLAAGRLDAVLLDDIIAQRYGCPLQGVECVDGDATLGQYVIGIRKDDGALRDAINQALSDMQSSGELKSILDREGLWNAHQEGPPPKEPAATVEKRHLGMGELLLFVEGAGITLILSILAFALAVPLGLGLATARLYGGRLLGGASAVYVEIFRGTPVLLQLYVLYFALAPLFKLNAFTAAVLGLGLNYAAYEAEIYRGALNAIPRGQHEAASALGMGGAQTLRHVLLPQALRIALPPMTNDFVALLKDSSVVSVITVVELTKRMTIAAVDLNDWITPGLVCAALYFLLSFPLATIARTMEKRLRVDPRPGDI